MASVNKAILIGNLGADPEIKYTPSGTAVANFSLATREQWTNKDNEKKERTEWHRIVLWDKQADNAAEYLKKGSLAYVEGRIETKSWEDNQGIKKYTTEIIGNKVIYLDTKSNQKEEEQNIPGMVQVPVTQHNYDLF